MTAVPVDPATRRTPSAVDATRHEVGHEFRSCRVVADSADECGACSRPSGRGRLIGPLSVHRSDQAVHPRLVAEVHDATQTVKIECPVLGERRWGVWRS